MSTTYYALRHPVVRVEQPNPRLLVYTLHDDDIKIGELSPTTLHLVADRDEKVALRDNAGSIAVYATGPDDMQAISEYGDLVTLGQLRRGEAP